MTHHIKLFVAAALLLFGAQQSKGFALLGPFADWMQPTNGFYPPYDIGGPMDLGEEYRWNVPLLTYGFDQTFIDYFGSNGVTAVEQAFQVLNDLPPASSISLASYSTNLPRMNPSAESQQLLDLKTATLGLMLEQLGLAQPTRSIFVLRQWDPIFETIPDSYQWPEGVIPTNVLERNFDPESLLPSHSVNDSLFIGSVFDNTDVYEQLVDPTDLYGTAIADQELQPGKFFMGLSSDDAGGLRYLLHTNNVNHETLLADVHGATNQSYVNAAMRPGVNKITFVRQQFDSLLQQWNPVTNQFTDTYLTNNQTIQQSLERIVTTPDFLFSVAVSFTNFFTTRTSNWLNHGGLESLGPGVIRTPAKIVFSKSRPVIFTDDFGLEFPIYRYMHIHWASFDESTNSPVVYPVESFLETNQFTVHFKLQDYFSPTTHQFEWHPAIPFKGTAALQTSTNLITWTTITTITNIGGTVYWHHSRALSKRFFRVVAE